MCRSCLVYFYGAAFSYLHDLVQVWPRRATAHGVRLASIRPGWGWWLRSTAHGASPASTKVDQVWMLPFDFHSFRAHLHCWSLSETRLWRKGQFVYLYIWQDRRMNVWNRYLPPLCAPSHLSIYPFIYNLSIFCPFIYLHLSFSLSSNQ